MQIWAVYTIIASFLWAFVNISDHYLVKKYSTGEKTTGGLVIFSSLIGLVISGAIAIFTPNLFNFSILDKILLIISGVFSVLWIILYLFAMEIEEVSVVAPWFLTVPVFGYIFGYLFLGETLTLHQQMGSLITFVGLILLNLNFSKDINKRFKYKAALYMLSACLIIAMQGILFKHIAIEDSFWVSSFWQYLGLGICGTFLYFFVPKYRKEFSNMNKQGGGEIFALNVSSEFVSVFGNLLSNFAMLLAPVTLVYLLGSFQPAFVLILSVLGTLFFPKIIKEDITFKVLIPKIIAIIVMIVGSIVLFS